MNTDWTSGFRVYFGRDGNVLVILLTGGTKKRQERDIEDARAYWQDDKNRNADGAERRGTMAKTKSFKALVRRQSRRTRSSRQPLLREGVDAMLSGDVETGKTILRDYIKATVG